VERKRVKQDRRIVQVTFSKKGKRIHQYVAASRVAIARGMLKALGPGAREGLLQRLTKLTAASEQGSKPAGKRHGLTHS
ncbi:MAG: hypothetical protein ACRD5L_00235, partial [Bryobacteraceae bacterium]